MKRLCLFFAMQSIVLLASAINNSNVALEKAIEKTDSVFMFFKTIAEEKQGYNVSVKMLYLLDEFFFPSELDAPNEFNDLGFPNDLHQISVYRYTWFFREMFNNEKFRNVSFDYTILRNECCVLEGPASETTPEFAKIVVRKTYGLQDSVLKVFSDTLILDLEYMKICKWTNDAQALRKVVTEVYLNASPNSVKSEIERQNAFLSCNNRKRKGVES